MPAGTESPTFLVQLAVHSRENGRYTCIATKEGVAVVSLANPKRLPRPANETTATPLRTNF